MREPGDVNDEGIHIGVTGPPVAAAPVADFDAVEEESTETVEVAKDKPRAHTRRVKPGQTR